jgi:4-amino-4-deoxy-L-arabinose transferase-like glycosyltransferase
MNTTKPTAPEDLLDRLARGARAYLILAALAIAAGVCGLFTVPPLDRDESRFVQATAQMLETGDFVRINVQDEPRNKKPVGIHWLQAASVSATTGVEARGIWAYRLASLLGGVIFVLATFWAGAALLGRRAAFIGAALLAVSLLASTEAMIAKTDAMMAAMTAVSLAAIAQLRAAPRRPRLLALAAWGALGVGILIKGPITPMVVGLGLAAIGLWERRWAWMGPLAHWSGPLLAGLITLPWMIAIGIETNGQFFADALVGDLAPKVSAGGEHPFLPPGLHTALLPFLLFPASLGLIPATLLAWRTLRAPRAAPEGAGVRFLLAWALPSFLVFEAATTKLVHYPLPTYPAFALLCGLGILTWWGTGKAYLRTVAAGFFALGGLVLVAGVAALAIATPGDAGADQRRAMMAAMAIGIPLLAAAVAIALQRRVVVVVGIAAAMGVFGVWLLRERTLPYARDVLVSRGANDALIREGLHPRLSTPQPAGALYVIGYREASLVFETSTKTKLALGAEAGASAVSGDSVVVEGRERDRFIAGLAARGLYFAPAGPPVVGQNYSNGDDVSLQPGRVVSVAPR